MTAPASSNRDLSGRRLGRYEVLAQLASGGMATVYAARAQGVAGFERLVAIKVLHPHLAHDDEFISMFLDEARLAARIRHPNVVPTLDISDSQGDGYFLVMEYIEGDHLGAVLREAARAGGNLAASVVLRVVIDALEGLHAAHELTDADGRPLGIVHRDVSPHNILVGTDGIARITDFGVAKAEVRLSSTRDGQFKGKLAYMAPEQASSGFADRRSDIFGMGVVLWEALVGRRLFKAENNGELLNRLLYLPIPVPSEYEPELAPLDDVLAKALARDPAVRFQSAAEFAEAIEAVAPQVGGLANQRLVARTIRDLLGPKVEAEGTRIRAAIAALGRSEVPSAVVPRPEPSGLLTLGKVEGTPSGQTPSGVVGREPGSKPARRVGPEDVTLTARPPPGKGEIPASEAIEGSAIEGSAIEGSAIEGSAIEGSAIEGSNAGETRRTRLVAVVVVAIVFGAAALGTFAWTMRSPGSEEPSATARRADTAVEGANAPSEGPATRAGGVPEPRASARPPTVSEHPEGPSPDRTRDDVAPATPRNADDADDEPRVPLRRRSLVARRETTMAPDPVVETDSPDRATPAPTMSTRPPLTLQDDEVLPSPYQ